ncbi:cupin domain-containing protein [Candidatus Dependentiae bacterium]|nr:cupin domain-containing protein [Candidatus Dependentiae bacterium]
MSVINISKKLSAFSDLWSPKIITELNDSYVKLAKLKGEYVWHKHDNEDEMFLIIDGQLSIELRDQILNLKAGELVVIPKGVEHRPVAHAEVSVILIEPKTTLSTGDAKNTEQKKSTHGEWI